MVAASAAAFAVASAADLVSAASFSDAALASASAVAWAAASDAASASASATNFSSSDSSSGLASAWAAFSAAALVAASAASFSASISYDITPLSLIPKRILSLFQFELFNPFAVTLAADSEACFPRISISALSLFFTSSTLGGLGLFLFGSFACSSLNLSSKSARSVSSWSRRCCIAGSKK